MHASFVVFQVKAGFDGTSNSFNIVTEIPYGKGDQAFISYGPHDNAKLLLEYGFILPHNHHNAVKVGRGFAAASPNSD